MQITARQSLPRSRSISPSLPQPTNAGVEPRPSDILAALGRARNVEPSPVNNAP